MSTRYAMLARLRALVHENIPVEEQAEYRKLIDDLASHKLQVTREEGRALSFATGYIAGQGFKDFAKVLNSLLDRMVLREGE